MNNLETLPKDALFSIAIELDLPNLLAFCNSNKRINDLICKKNDIWYYKIRQEFPELNYFEKKPKEYYMKVKEILKTYLEWKKILPLLDIEKYEYKQRKSPKGEVYALLKALKENVLEKIIDDYNEIIGIKKIKKVKPIKVIKFLEDRGLVYDEEFMAYYQNLILELQDYIKNPNYSFNYSKWEDLFN